MLTLTAINSVDLNGRSLYIVDWQMAVVETGECHTPCKKGGTYVRGECVQIRRVRIPNCKNRFVLELNHHYLVNARSSAVAERPRARACLLKRIDKCNASMRLV